MTRTLVVALLVVAGAALAPSARAGCPHLVVDPRGDVRETVSSPHESVEDTREADLLSADLSDTRQSLTATFHLVALGSQVVEAHLYEIGFSTETDRWYLRAQIGQRRPNDEYELVHVVGSRDAPEDTGSPSGAFADTVTGSFRPATATITVTAPRALFGEGLHGPLQLIRVNVDNGVRVPAANVYPAYADQGRTDRTYRLGRRSC